MIPDEAVEAAAKAYYELRNGEWEDVDTEYRSEELVEMRAALEAAAPHMHAPQLGAGDYLPIWDDRKELARIWQGHAPLPAEGLSEAVYDALIAVASWGYEQRIAEAPHRG